jgi:hypothetical protein
MDASSAALLASASAPMDTDGFTFTRAPRHRLIRRATIHVGGQSLQIIIRNVSTGGALIEVARELTPGTLAKLEVGGFNLIDVEVKWSRGKHAGLRFISDFDLRGLMMTKSMAGPNS